MSFTNGTISGIVPYALNPAIAHCCKTCTHGHGETIIDYISDGHNRTSENFHQPDLLRDINSNPELSLPLVGFTGQEIYGIHRYVGLVESGGVAFVVKGHSSEQRTHAVIHMVFAVAPTLSLTTLVLIVVGMLMWILVSLAFDIGPFSFGGVSVISAR